MRRKSIKKIAISQGMQRVSHAVCPPGWLPLKWSWRVSLTVRPTTTTPGLWGSAAPNIGLGPYNYPGEERRLRKGESTRACERVEMLVDRACAHEPGARPTMALTDCPHTHIPAPAGSPGGHRQPPARSSLAKRQS